MKYYMVVRYLKNGNVECDDRKFYDPEEAMKWHIFTLEHLDVIKELNSYKSIQVEEFDDEED